MRHKAYTFNIEMPSEYAAGLRGFTEQVQIVVESGDSGGEDGEFAEYMRQCLAEWFDGAGVNVITPNPGTEQVNKP